MYALLTIIQKEWAEFKAAFFSRLNLYSGYLSVIVFMAICCVYVPLQYAGEWKDSPKLAFLYIVVVPFCTIGTMIPSAFVLERERRTLEPLLASPAPDASIFLGKVIPSAILGWISALSCSFATWVILNRSIFQSGLVLYPPPLAISLVGFSLLISFLISVIGAAASLRARTYIQAQARLTAMVFGPMFASALVMGPFFPPSWKIILDQILRMIGYPTYLWALAILLILTILAAIAFSLHSFHRTQLLSHPA